MAAHIKRGSDGLWYVNSIPCSTQEEAMQRLKSMDPEGYEQITRSANALAGEGWKVFAGWAVILMVAALLSFGAYKLLSKSPERATKNKEAVTLGNMQYLAQGYVKGVLKDPSSAQFRNQRGACGEVNSKNSFGGYIGFQRYIAAGKDLVILERDSGLPSNQFDTLWAKSCT